MPTFQNFQSGMGGAVCRRIGIDISGLSGWRQFTEAVVQMNGARNGCVVDAARKFAGVASSGELAVLVAALAAADFAWLADELEKSEHWERIMYMGDEVRTAVAAVVLRQD